MSDQYHARKALTFAERYGFTSVARPAHRAQAPVFVRFGLGCVYFRVRGELVRVQTVYPFEVSTVERTNDK